jgi:gliding motility-associated-like protein
MIEFNPYMKRKNNKENAVICFKNNIFEASQTRKNNIMKGYTAILNRIVPVMFLLFAGNYAAAQCTIQYSGAECVGSPIQFLGASTGTTHDWDFNGENTSSGQKNLNYAFKSPGVKNIRYITTINGTKCTSNIQITIKTSPVPKLKLLTAPEQCFKNNLFCFSDSTKNPNGSAIRSAKYVVGDGQFFQNSSVINPFCYNIKDVRGGCFDLYVEYTDANGCAATDTIICAAKVREAIGPAFTSNKPVDCDSVTALIRNISRIAQNKVKTITWYWGDGTTGNQWGPNITKKFYKPGVYDIKMVIETTDGCKDSFEMKAAAQVLKGEYQIVADKDSTCISDPEIKFSLTPQPVVGISSFLWNFGDPPSGNQNTNNRSLAPPHSFSGLGPFQVKFTYDIVCGGITRKKVAYDTVLIIGPQSTIEIPFNRIAEFEVFQCPKDVQDTVHFKNFSKFYHNDKNMWNDDSTFKKWPGNYHPGHVFDNNQTWVKPKGFVDPLFRQRVCAVRLWNFGDNYAPKCTTDRLNNKNVNVNCQYSHDSLPTHYYKSWDLVMLSDFKNAPMEDAIFIESTRLCKKINVWPSDTNWIIEDTMLVIPKSKADSLLADQSKYALNKTKTYLWEKGIKGPAERYITDNVDVLLKAGDSAYIGPETGPFTLQVGPKTISLSPKQIIKLKSPTDSFRFLFTVFLKKDTLPAPLLRIRTKKGENPRIIGFIKRTFPGTAGLDYKVDYKRWRELYYAQIPQCNNVRLWHGDTCHPLACTSENIKQLSMLHANAGGVGSGLVKDAIECLGGKNPQYGITFILSDLKPGCTFSYVGINYDTFCKPTTWTTLTSGLVPGNRPPGMPYMGYQIANNPPSRYSKQYSASEVCNPNGCITVGIIVGNGVKKGGTVGDPPLCADTQYYDKFACFPLIDPSFEVVTPTPNAAGIRKICKNDPVVVRPIGANKTKNDDLKNLRWEFATGNASPAYSKQWGYQIQEDYYRGVYLKDSGTKRIYNLMVQSRYETRPEQLPCSTEWQDDSRTDRSVAWNDGKHGGKLDKTPDTIVTAIISKWDTAADVSAVWDRIKERLEARGFDPFAIDPAQITRMIWNNTGIIGQPLTGAKGCIDTNGFGRFIKFYLRPDPASKKIIHERDTNIRPLDSAIVGNKKVRAYTFRSPWAGYHLASISMTSANGKCDEFAAYPVIVGFAAMIELPDSTICQDQATNLQARLDLRYFHPDPLNFGTWDPYDYWRDAQRQADIFAGVKNREPFTRWDWNKRDDDPNNPVTKFGGAPYGATGVGSPWFQLGGGPNDPKTIYYKNDSGVYEFRVAVGDSTGCRDTISKRLFISRLDVNFGLNLEIPSCNSIIELFDSTKLFDPCNWAIRNCNGPTPIECDFIREYFIDWGDSKTNYFTRGKSSDELLPPSLAHKYTRNGWFQITIFAKTDQGCADTIKRWIKIPGPRPKFEYADYAGFNITICEGEAVRFKNLTDTATKGADWTWFYGDGALDNKKDTFVNHVYTKPGKYYVFLEQYDTLFVPPNLKRFCPATYPDTGGGQRAFIVTVIKRDTVRGFIVKPSICPGDTNEFVDNSDTLFKSYKWRFENLSTGSVDTVTVTTKNYKRQFTVPGRYRVTHLADYGSNHPRPWCPTPPVIDTFLVDSVIANFDIDSSGKPDFVFTRTDVNGTEWRWGFGHQNDIKNTLPKDFIENLKSDDKSVKWSYDSSGTYWVCLIVKNATGCVDTICKPVTVDLFIYLANVFTPGKNDGKNDTYRVPIQGHDLFELKIFNRWGERVFQTENAKVGWNGQVNNDGPEVPEGTYFYQLTYRFKGKQQKYVSGSVNLIRAN